MKRMERNGSNTVSDGKVGWLIIATWLREKGYRMGTVIVILFFMVLIFLMESGGLGWLQAETNIPANWYWVLYIVAVVIFVLLMILFRKITNRKDVK